MNGTASARSSRERRATFAFAVTGIFTLVVLVLYGGLAFTATPTVGIGYLIGPFIGAAALLAAALGLHRRRNWAEGVVTPMLIVLIISGLVTLLLTLLSGGWDFPIGAIVAAWALLAPSRAAYPERSPGGLALLGALVLSAVWPYVIGPLLGGLS